MRTIFETCTPRPEVLKGELPEEIFAARLKEVVDGRADPVYQDPATYFENTYPTQGLRLLLSEALGRLTGLHPANNAILRLETAFGGGKTHNLIGLYHLAAGRATPAMARGLVGPELVAKAGQVQVAAVVGSDLDPVAGLAHPQHGLRTRTLWGELAYQLGGQAGYGLTVESERTGTAPGTGLFEELVGDRPALILLDEMARYMRVAQTVPSATGKSDLGEQTVAFLMALLEFAAGRPNAVVVLTLAESGDAFANETAQLRQQLTEARRISARSERVITPTQETEIAAIVRHRLFETVDTPAARAAAEFYADAYGRWNEQNVALPQRALRAEYAAEIAEDYPFHPELLNTLNRKVSTIPNFQKTRGALRLLALTVRHLWAKRPAGCWLVHPHHVDLAVSAIAEDLTGRLERAAYKQVIEADITSTNAGSPAHAQAFDRPGVQAGKPPYAQRVASAVFLHSLTLGIASGVDPGDLFLAVLSPGDEPLLVHRAAGDLDDHGWFFEWDGHRYRFKTEPSLNKIIADEMGMVPKTKAKAELDQRIRQVWRSGPVKAEYFPQEAADIDDDAGPPKLCVIHYDAAQVSSVDPTPPDLVRKIAELAGSLEAYRRFRNNLVFLVADGERVDEMVDTARRYLAIARITGDAERMGTFVQEHRTKLKKMGEAAELDLRVAITRAYRHLYFPSGTALQRDGYLSHDLLPAQDQGDVQKDQSAVVLRALAQQNKLLTGNDPPLAAAYVRNKAWDTNQVQMTTEDLRQAFARRLGLPILLDLNQLKKSVLNGIATQVWIYYDAAASVGYDHASPPPAVQVGDDAYLYLPTEAARLRLEVKGRQKVQPATPTCPVCGNPVDHCTCGEVVLQPPKPPLRGEGPPQQAFQQLLDLCHDQGVTALSELRITLRGEDKAGARNLRTLGLAVPQLGKGEFDLEQTYNAEFGQGLYISSRLALGWELYRRLKQVTDALSQEASSFAATTTLRVRLAGGAQVDGDAFRTLHEVMTTVGLDKIEVEGVPQGPPQAGDGEAGA